MLHSFRKIKELLAILLNILEDRKNLMRILGVNLNLYF